MKTLALVNNKGGGGNTTSAVMRLRKTTPTFRMASEISCNSHVLIPTDLRIALWGMSQL
jgi:hypothetical protein